MITSSSLISIITFVYGLAALLYITSWVFKKELPGKLATATTIIAAGGNLIGIILRWVESYQQGIGHAPLSNLYESLVFFALCIAVLYLFLELRYKLRVIGVVAIPLAFLAMAYTSLTVDSTIEPLIPALQSNWLIAHVITCFIGYAGFAVAFGISILYFIKSDRNASSGGLTTKIPHVAMLDEFTHQMVIFGFLFLSVGIITGAVWANQAWGRYWGWDPKETWSLVTWLIYASLLHARLMRGWTGKRIAVLSFVGFVAVIFTYFGVNLLPGLHSYQ